MTKVRQGQRVKVTGPVTIIYNNLDLKSDDVELLFLCPDDTMVIKKGYND